MPRKTTPKRVKTSVLSELRKLEELGEFEEKTAKIIEEKVYEIKAIVYLILIIVVILLCLVLGVLLKSLGF